MRKLIKCGRLFSGRDGSAQPGQAIAVEDGVITFVGPAQDAPNGQPFAETLDYSRLFVMPGLIDAHVHLSYGNAMNAEELDLYASLEFRALRGLEGSQRMLAAGYTGLADPSTTGNVSLAIRDAISAGLFTGPRIATAGRAILTAQGVDNFYPRWVKSPDTAVGLLIRDVREGIAEIRQEVKDGVDFIKIAIDGDELVSGTGLVAGLTQEETSALIGEAHRLGRKVAVHARGAEGVLYAARAGADFILHASWMDERGLEWVVRNGCALLPTLSLLVNNIDFARPGDAAYDFVEPQKRELEAAARSLGRARDAGVPFMVGSEAGFAVTPYGEWPARELEHYVKYLGFTPGQALASTTAINARVFGNKVGVIEAGRIADLIAVDGDPLADVGVLQDRARLKAILIGGEPVSLALGRRPQRLLTERAHSLWSDIYTREKISGRPAAS